MRSKSPLVWEFNSLIVFSAMVRCKKRFIWDLRPGATIGQLSAGDMMNVEVYSASPPGASRRIHSIVIELVILLWVMLRVVRCLCHILRLDIHDDGQLQLCTKCSQERLFNRVAD